MKVSNIEMNLIIFILNIILIHGMLDGIKLRECLKYISEKI